MEHLRTQGISLPRLGLGTFRMQGDICRAAVESAPRWQAPRSNPERRLLLDCFVALLLAMTNSLLGP